MNPCRRWRISGPALRVERDDWLAIRKSSHSALPERLWRRSLRPLAWPKRRCTAGCTPMGSRSGRSRGTDAVVAEIRNRWEGGCHNAAAIWRALAAKGFRGSKRMVQREIAHLGLSTERSRTRSPPLAKPPSPRHLAWLFGRDGDAGTEEDLAFLRTLCAGSPELSKVRDLARRFVVLLREHDLVGFERWLQEAEQSELRGFARSLQTDFEAVRAAVETTWSNGPTEGHVNRLKTLKRAMYGRAGFALLKARMLHAA
jgi:transposase